MLKNTFIHIPNIGEKWERHLWSEGILSWEDLCQASEVKGFSTKHLNFLKSHILTSEKKLACSEAGFFTRNMPSEKYWRIWPEFREKTAFIDIETTGLAAEYHDITTIGLYSNGILKHYVLGENLDSFKDDIYDYSVLVTFNGKRFDIPFIETKLGIRLNHAHIDLRWVLRSLNITGGLKKCEIKLGISRGELEGVSGVFAPALWGEYKRNNNIKALETLIAYNLVDVLNLERILIIAYNKKIENTPVKDRNLIPEPNQPVIPFKADNQVIDKIRKQLGNNPFSSFSPAHTVFNR